MLSFNISAAGLIQAVCTKTAGLHVALGMNISGVVSARELLKHQKDSASLVVCNENKIFWLGLHIFVSDVITKGLLGHFAWPTSPGPGPKPLDGSTLLKFLFKTGYNLSLLILQMTCWGFGLKSYDQKQ